MVVIHAKCENARIREGHTVNCVLIETSPITRYPLCSIVVFEYRSFVQRLVGIRDTRFVFGTSPAVFKSSAAHFDEFWSSTFPLCFVEFALL